MARLAYDNRTLLVPGLPEAANEQAALEAVRRFAGWFKTRQAGEKVDAKAWRWVCEYCFRTCDTMVLPVGWDFVLQSAICPRCQPRVERGGGIFVVVGGAFAGKRRDPRAGKEVA